jgi:hypothetical protein
MPYIHYLIIILMTILNTECHYHNLRKIEKSEETDVLLKGDPRLHTYC